MMHISQSSAFSHEGISKVLDALDVGIFSYDVENSSWNKNKAMFEMFDVPVISEQSSTSDDLFWSGLHPVWYLNPNTLAATDDVGKAAAQWHACLNGENGGSYCATYRICHKNGTVSTLHTRGETVVKDGLKSIVGIVQDVTEMCRLTAEEAKKEAANARLEATLAAVSSVLASASIH
eukprot:12433-Heterococcus_DN1.PRE.6